MESKIWKILKAIVYGIFVLVFVFVTLKLFFADFIDNKSSNLEENVMKKKEVLTVIYPDEIGEFEPTFFNPTARQRLVNVYEPLVVADKDLNMKPSLAISWGLLDDYTWEFRLRSGVKFHDGSAFDVQDVLASFERAARYERSELKDLLSTIRSVKAVDSATIQITTLKPDPLLLQKVSNVLIISSDEVEMPTGTGPFMLSSWKFGERMELIKNDEYWGGDVPFDTVVLKVEMDKSLRVNDFLNGGADMLAFVPFDAVAAVKERGFETVSVPSLEVQFLLFNVNSSLLKDVKAREFLAGVFDKTALSRELGGFALPVDQFVSDGVFGFNPKIHNFPKSDVGLLKGKTLQLHLLKGLDVLGEFVRKSLKDSDVNVIVSYLDGNDFLKSLDAKKADMYFFGFKSDIGDSVDFFKTVVKSGADFNVMNYSDAQVDALIDQGLTELDARRRRAVLQELMEIVVRKDVLGSPLFQYETVFATNNSIDFVPRIDGLIYFNEITVK